jgi:hypothetical protein
MNKLIKKLEQLTTLHNEVYFSYKGDKRRSPWRLGKVVDEVSQFWTDGRDAYKHFIQKIEGEGGGGIGFRFCYYTLDGAKIRIRFGGFGSYLGESDFKELMKKARRKAFF